MTIDAVLPVVGPDAERASILRESIELRFPDLGTCWVVAPRRDHGALSHLDGGRFRLVDERDIVPARPRVEGWYLQQLIKLAIAETVRSPHYLTLDADVVLMRPLRVDDMVRDGRAVVQAHRNPVHDDWYEWAQRLLGLPRSGWTHGVTPAVMSVGAVRELAEFLSGLAARSRRPRQWAARALRGDRDWRSFLLRAVPWTEYAVYHTFLEASGRFDAHHVLQQGEYLYGRSVWFSEDFERWDPVAEFSPPGRPFFAVIQSKANIDPAVVRRRLEPVLRPDPQPADQR